MLSEMTRMNIAGMADKSLWLIVSNLSQSLQSLRGDDRKAAVEMIFAAIDELRVREARHG